MCIPRVDSLQERALHFKVLFTAKRSTRMVAKNLLSVAIVVMTMTAPSNVSLANAPQEGVYVFTGKVTAAYFIKENGGMAITMKDFQSCRLIEAYKEKPISVKRGEIITVFTTGDGTHFQIHGLSKVPAVTVKRTEKIIYSDQFYSNPHFRRCAPR